MNYYGGPGAEKSGISPGGYYPGASYGLQQQAALAHGHPQAAGMTPGLAQHPGLAPGHGQQTTVPSYGTPVSTHSYTGYTGMAPGQSIYTTTGYSIPQGYPSAMNGSAGLTSMGAFYSTPHMSALPYSTLQPIPQATPSIPSVASLPSVPAVPHIPSIQQTQSGYPASHRQHQLSSAYLSEQAAKQAGYPIGSNPMMHPGMSSASVPGMPHGYPAGGAVPGMGYPNPSLTNAYAGMPGVRVAPHTGQPYGPRY
ncbi:elastin-like [Mytilus trossulus]|uniref:elastin-like n=1 Tax=Mytilus trossulus TaxID=6551 RepID=UPI00300481BF